MFWDSIWNGLSMFQYGEVWIALGICIAINAAFLMLVGVSTMSGDPGAGRQLAGCLSYVLGGTAINVVLVSMLVGYLLPILIGDNEPLAWADLTSIMWPLAKAGFIAFIITFVLSMIPVVGRLFDLPGVDKFVQAIIIYRMIIDPYLPKDSNVIFPDLFQIIGYALICVVLAWLFAAALALIQTALKESAGNFLMGVVAPSMGLVVGVAVLFMYSANVLLSNM